MKQLPEDLQQKKLVNTQTKSGKAIPVDVLVTKISKLAIGIFLFFSVGGCGNTSSSTFALRDAQLAYPEFSKLAQREPVPYELLGGGVLAHRIHPGEKWLIGYREFKATGLPPSAHNAVVQKITISFAGTKKPSGRYEFRDKDGITAYATYAIAGTSHHFWCYGQIGEGAISIRWPDEKKFEVELDAKLTNDLILPKNPAICKESRLQLKFSGSIVEIGDLTPWDGLPKSFSEQATNEAIEEQLP